MKTVNPDCATCEFYNNDRQDQPCCSCREFCNYSPCEEDCQ